MNSMDLERIMEREPTLNTIGFGLSNIRRYTREERAALLKKHREELKSEIEVCGIVADC